MHGFEISDVINESCGKLIVKKDSQGKELFRICYNLSKKGADFVGYKLYANTVNKLNIKNRPKFFNDKTLSKHTRSTHSDYTRNKYSMDRGHLVWDAAFDYNKQVLKQTYVMSNIIPQHSSINQEPYARVEKRSRALAKKHGEVSVLNGVIYNSSVKIGKNKISVPSAFWKFIYVPNGKSECYYFKNVPISNPKAAKIKDYKFSCSKLGLI